MRFATASSLQVILCGRIEKRGVRIQVPGSHDQGVEYGEETVPQRRYDGGSERCESRRAIRDNTQIPISSVNQEIEKSLRNKPRLILLHRCDLITKQQQLAELRYFQQRNERVLLTSVKTGTNMNAIIPSLLAVRQSRFTSVGSYFAVMGIPNVGKSSIIRSIQKSTASFRKSTQIIKMTCRLESKRWRHSRSDEACSLHESACATRCVHDRHSGHLPS